MSGISDIIDVDGGRRELEGRRITVGVSTCGLSAGAGPTLKTLQGGFSEVLVDPVGCSGMCFNEPIVTVRDSSGFSIYHHVTEDRLEGLVDAISSERVWEEQLAGHGLEEIDYYRSQQRQVMKNCGVINPLSIQQYAASGGFRGLENAMGMQPSEIIKTVKNAKLRGRGGAGFLAGLKWEFLSMKEGLKYLVCNGDEGDPGAFMNRTIMESDPYKLLEGMIIASYAMGVQEAFIYTRAEYPLAIRTVEKAIKTLKEHDILGEEILEKEGFNLDIKIKKGAGAFVCGEETALMNSIEGYRGHPRPRPPYPAEKGLWNNPTNINNVGTLSNVPLILAGSVQEYCKVGTDESKGTKIICLTGKVNRPGVIEVPFGTPIRDIVYDIGGGVPEGTELKAVQTGGPAGGCIPAYNIDIQLDYETLAEAGAIVGSGGLVVMNSQDCMVDVSRYFMKFTQQESCGKCTPCREGTMRLLEILEKITEGAADRNDLLLIKRLSEFVRDTSLCGLGMNAPNPVLSTMKYFMDEYVEHVSKRKCGAGVCKNMLEFSITDSCVGCGNCARACPAEAITGKLKQRHVIDQDKCIKCGACYRNCAFKAIDKSGGKRV